MAGTRQCIVKVAPPSCQRQQASEAGVVNWRFKIDLTASYQEEWETSCELAA